MCVLKHDQLKVLSSIFVNPKVLKLWFFLVNRPKCLNIFNKQNNGIHSFDKANAAEKFKRAAHTKKIIYYFDMIKDKG